jgi:hypothetical protein
MSKRSAELALESKAAGKQRLMSSDEEAAANEMLLNEMLGGLSESEQNQAVHSVVNGVQTVSDDFFDADIVLAGLAEEPHTISPPELPELPELAVGELPAELTEDALTSGAELDLSSINIDAAQARRMAPLICSNSDLNVIKFAQHELMIGELREEVELEWDSEEYTDIEAIFIAEFVKHSRVLKRLDLARNQIGDDGAIALAAAVSVNPAIEYLNLESNNLSGTGAQPHQRSRSARGTAAQQGTADAASILSRRLCCLLSSCGGQPLAPVPEFDVQRPVDNSAAGATLSKRALRGPGTVSPVGAHPCPTSSRCSSCVTRG